MKLLYGKKQHLKLLLYFLSLKTQYIGYISGTKWSTELHKLEYQIKNKTTQKNKLQILETATAAVCTVVRNYSTRAFINEQNISAIYISRRNEPLE
jgi:hypothetical protein